MDTKIIVQQDEPTICPNCSHQFPIHQGITKQAIERYEREYDKFVQEQTAELEIALSTKIERSFSNEITVLKEELENSKEALKDAESRTKNLKKEAVEKARKEFEEEKKIYIDELEEKNIAIKDFRDKELGLRQERKKLEEEKQNLELEQQRKLDASKQEIERKIKETEAEKFQFKETEYKNKLDAALRANEELTRKLEQGSQQLQGEVLELELERLLRESFPYDGIQEIAKGVRGADVLQCVCTQNGLICGTIIWEAKRAQNWSDKWLRKLKDDCMAEKADIAVLVTTTLPRDCDEPFKIIEGVWVISNRVIRPVAETLRVMLIEANKLKIFNEGKHQKAELVYDYLCSNSFAQNVCSVIETFTYMKQDLEREKNAMTKYWRKRESQLERVAAGMSTMVGELQAIAQDSFTQLDKIDQLLLPGELDEE